MNDITGIIARLRLHKYAVTTEIEKRFFKSNFTKTTEMRQDSFGLMTQTNPNSPLATNRFRTILFGTTCSPFILYATLLKHLNINVSDLTETLKNGLYVCI